MTVTHENTLLTGCPVKRVHITFLIEYSNLRNSKSKNVVMICILLTEQAVSKEGTYHNYDQIITIFT